MKTLLTVAAAALCLCAMVLALVYAPVLKRLIERASAEELVVFVLLLNIVLIAFGIAAFHLMTELRAWIDRRRLSNGR